MSGKKIVMFFILVFLSMHLSAQISNTKKGNVFAKDGYEDGGHLSLFIAAAPAYLYGDVAGIKSKYFAFEDLKFEHVRYMISAGFRHNINHRFGYSANIAFGDFTAYEEDTRMDYRRYGYRSHLFQVVIQPEVTILRGYIKNTPYWWYGFVGIGVVHSKSKLTYAPIRPNDVFKPKETTGVASGGLGFGINVTPRVMVGTEMTAFYYFSDYIDGIYVPKWSKHNDVIGAMFFYVSYRFNGGSRGNGYNNRGYKCNWYR